MKSKEDRKQDKIRGEKNILKYQRWCIWTQASGIITLNVKKLSI